MQFITPKIRFKKNINFEKDYLESLKKSVNYFLNTVDKNKNFKKKDFYSSIKSNNLILKN